MTLAVQPSRTDATAPAPEQDSLTVLVLPDSTVFRTSLYFATVIGELRAQRKRPFLIMTGTGCTNCDANASIYVHSPSDGPMQDEATQKRYTMPGRVRDYWDGSPLSESRAFFGDCLPEFPNAVVWFHHDRDDDGQWHRRVYILRVESDSLVGFMRTSDLPSVSIAETAVVDGRCREIPGEDVSSEH